MPAQTSPDAPSRTVPARAIARQASPLRGRLGALRSTALALGASLLLAACLGGGGDRGNSGGTGPQLPTKAADPTIVTSTKQQTEANRIYRVQSAQQVEIDLPKTDDLRVGDIIVIKAEGPGGWTVNQQEGQRIDISDVKITNNAVGLT